MKYFCQLFVLIILLEFLMDKIKAWLKKNKKILFIGAFFVFLLILAVVFFGQKKNKENYQTNKVQKETIISSVSASGSVISANIMAVNSQTTGIVKTVYVQNGQLVRKGDKLIEIELDQNGTKQNQQNYAAYLSAKNSFESAKYTQNSLQAEMFGKWDTFKELAESSNYQNDDGTPKYENRALPEFHIPEKEWLAAEAKYKNQDQVIKQAESALASSWSTYELSSPTVTAPISGTVEGLSVVEGMVISNQGNDSEASNNLGYIKSANANPVVSVNLSEVDVNTVKTGQKATITIDSYANKTFTGSVLTVNKIGAVNNNVTQYPALIQLDSASSAILPNMAVTANIIVATKVNVLIVPSAAITTTNGQPTVTVLQNNQPLSTAVETGISSGTKTEIVSGLKEGNLIINSAVSGSENSSNPFSNTGGMGSGVMRMAR